MSTGRVRAANISGYDWLLVVAVVALIILGLMMVYSSTAFHGLKYRLDANPSLLFLKQVLWTAAGVVVLILLARVNYHRWRRFSVLVLAGTLALLGLVLVLGREEFGAQRWLIGRLIGAEGGSIQPSELAKLTMILYAADWLASKGERIRQVRAGLVPFAVLLGLVVGLIVLQHHLTSAAIVAANGIVMFFVAGGSIWQMLVCGVLGGVSIVLLILESPYRLERVLTFISPFSEQAAKDSPSIQNLIALASGGLTGVGLGESRGKFGYVSVPHSDNIFAILGEEMGLIGCLAVLGLFAFVAYRGFRIAMNAPDMFGTLLATGITFGLVFQAIYNIAVVTATAPIAGITLPFISYGGSSMVVSLASIGLLLSISRATMVSEGTNQLAGGALSSETYDFWGRDRRARLSRTRRDSLFDRPR